MSQVQCNVYRLFLFSFRMGAEAVLALMDAKPETEVNIV